MSFRWGTKDFQDEKFSYVVLRRGWRREDDSEDVQISPFFYQQIKPDDLEIEWTPGKAGKMNRERQFFEEKQEMAWQSDPDALALPQGTSFHAADMPVQADLGTTKVFRCKSSSISFFSGPGCQSPTVCLGSPRCSSDLTIFEEFFEFSHVFV